MAIYKRGEVYWYQFQFNGQRIQESAQTSNKDAARQIEGAHRVRLAEGECVFRRSRSRFRSDDDRHSGVMAITIGAKRRWLVS